MRLKPLYRDRYAVVAVMIGGCCPTEDFLNEGELSTQAARDGLSEMLKHVAELGLDGVPSQWVHEASKDDKIYEFIKGPLRLFFFKGANGQIAVCTCGVRKSGRKADKASVRSSARLRSQYFEAYNNRTLSLVEDDED